MLRALYDRVMGFAEHPQALALLALIAFIESSVFPLPPDILLVPMVLAARTRAWRIALVCTVASVAGGLAGYAIGYYLFDAVGRPLLDFYGYGAEFEAFRERYNAWGAWIVAGAGLTPFPYKVITIASGATGLDLATFMIASTLSRGARFAAETALLWYFGPPMRQFVERHLGKVTAAAFLVLIGGFALVKWLA